MSQGSRLQPVTLNATTGTLPVDRKQPKPSFGLAQEAFFIATKGGSCLAGDLEVDSGGLHRRMQDLSLHALGLRILVYGLIDSLKRDPI